MESIIGVIRLTMLDNNEMEMEFPSAKGDRVEIFHGTLDNVTCDFENDSFTVTYNTID